LADANVLTLNSLAQFFENALAISAWKEFEGSRWALRCNPSSGNLHPTEGYVVTEPIVGLHDAPAVYHYRPADHSLERRCAFGADTWAALSSGFPPGTFFVGLSSIHWREAWKYGERAFRYCQHDVGHAFASCALSAVLQGWRTTHLIDLDDANVAALLGLNRDADFPDPLEHEAPDLLAAVYPADNGAIAPRSLPAAAIAAIADCPWQGHANRLSSDHEDWGVISAIADSCQKPHNVKREIDSSLAPGSSEKRNAPCGKSAVQIIQQRRSAVSMDGQTAIARETFYTMMQRVMPREGVPLWEALGPPVYVHLALFVHRVNELPPGLYALARHPGGESTLRESLKEEFCWVKPEGCPADLPLYRLEEGNAQQAATSVSCGQDIAGMGAFSLGMLAQFAGPLAEHGPWIYRRLFWETGAIGQVLYLEAEAAGIRATGIGCFFDDPVHQLFGIKDHQFQSLYHFTLGGPVEDQRLTTLDPYEPR
jgi:SagB-type dehydrogenase family enzyme